MRPFKASSLLRAFDFGEIAIRLIAQSVPSHSEGRIIPSQARISAERWATFCSIMDTCKMNNVEPYAYLRDVLQHMVDGHPINRLNELLPWSWMADIQRAPSD